MPKFVLIAILISCIWVGTSSADQNKISNLDAIEIAKGDLNKSHPNEYYGFQGIKTKKYFGSDIPFVSFIEEQMNADIEWSRKEGIPIKAETLKNFRNIRKTFQKLDSKFYWMVTFYMLSSSNIGGVIDGSTSVFVDAKTGEILFKW